MSTYQLITLVLWVNFGLFFYLFDLRSFFRIFINSLSETAGYPITIWLSSISLQHHSLHQFHCRFLNDLKRQWPQLKHCLQFWTTSKTYLALYHAIKQFLHYELYVLDYLNSIFQFQYHQLNLYRLCIRCYFNIIFN